MKLAGPAAVIALLWAALGVRVALVWDRLPALMTSHFGPGGRPNGWMSRSGFWLFTFLVEGGAVAFTLLSTSLLRRFPSNLINLPNRAYWLAPERRAATMQRLGGWMAWFSVFLSAFLVAVNELAIRANLAHGPLDERVFLVALGVFLGFGALWTVGLYRAFRLPPSQA